MRIIEQSHEIINLHDDALKQIERAGRTCFSSDTEILTENGWKNVQDIGEKEYVLTFNKTKNILEYQISNMFSKDYDGKMIESLHKLSSFCVTPDHRMVAKKSTTKKEYGFLEAENLLMKKNNHGYRLPVFFKGSQTTASEHNMTIEMPHHYYHSGNPSREMVINGRSFVLDDNFIKVMSAYICDGHLLHGNKGVVITKKLDSPLYLSMIEALRDLGWEYSIEDSANRPLIKSIIIKGGKPVGKWFEDNCGRGSLNKRIPAFFRYFSHRQLLVLFEAMMIGDGDIRTDVYGSSSKILIDQIVEIITLIGKSANVREHPVKGWTKNPHWTTQVKKADSFIIKPDQVIEIDYSGKVFCPQTINGIVCIRRNNQTMWIGNCYQSQDKITDDSAEKFVAMLQKRKHTAMIEFSDITVKFITNRGVTHELVRHRHCNFAQESTRYVKYDGDMEFIRPIWYSDIILGDFPSWGHIKDINSYLLPEEIEWMESCFEDEGRYMRLIELKQKAQQAREILPNSLKTEICMKTNIRDWLHIFELRTAKAAHPQMRALMIGLLNELKGKLPTVFGDINV